jgi:5-methylcytosine-specific restriction endonuclease McrA
MFSLPDGALTLCETVRDGRERLFLVLFDDRDTFLLSQKNITKKHGKANTGIQKAVTHAADQHKRTGETHKNSTNVSTTMPEFNKEKSYSERKTTNTNSPSRRAKHHQIDPWMGGDATQSNSPEGATRDRVKHQNERQKTKDKRTTNTSPHLSGTLEVARQAFESFADGRLAAEEVLQFFVLLRSHFSVLTAS